ncbi:MAG: hypothetical protein ACP5JP_06810, partial [bacterium]
MLKRILTIISVLGLVSLQLTGCGKQTTGLDTTSINQTTESSISSSVSDAVVLSSIANSQTGVGILGLDALSGGSSCPQVTKNLIGQNPTTYSVTIDFGNGCIPTNSFAPVTTSGTISMTVTLFTDVTTGKITEVTVDAQKAIVRTRWDGASLSINGTTDIVKTLSWSGNTLSDVTRSVNVNEERIALSPTGRMIMHHLIALHFTYSDTISGNTIIQRIINGNGSVDHELAKVTASAVITNLTLVNGCCHPVDGSITITLTRDSNSSLIGTYNLVYASNNQCSDVALLNGKQITLNPCD